MKRYSMIISGVLEVKIKIEKKLDTDNVHRKVINPKTNLPFSVPKKSWSVPVYFVWRMLRYDLGEDTSYPVIAQGMMVKHPQELETKKVLAEIESQFPILIGYENIRRIA